MFLRQKYTSTIRIEVKCVEEEAAEYDVIQSANGYLQNHFFRVVPQACQIRLIPSVNPTSFVSNSYKPMATVSVAARKPHQKTFRALGTLFIGT